MKHQKQFEKSLVDTLQLGNSATSDGLKAASPQIQETEVAAFLSRVKAGGVLSRFFEQWSKSDTFMSAILMHVFFHLVTRPMGIFSSLDVYSTIDEFCMTELHAETRKDRKIRVLLFPRRSPSNATEKCRNTHNPGTHLTSREKERAAQIARVPITEKSKESESNSTRSQTPGH